MKKTLIILILFANIIPIAAKQIILDLDYSTFKYNQDSTLIEIYYSFKANELTLKQNGDIFEGKLKIKAEFYDKIGFAKTDEWFASAKVKNPETSDMEIVGIRQFYLPKYELNCKISFYDENDTSKSSELIFQPVIKNFNEKKIRISMPIIAHFIEDENNKTANWGAMFQRNNIYVIPNPKKEIVGTEPLINLYYEVYNSKCLDFDSLSVIINIYNAQKTVVYDYKKKLSVAKPDDFYDVTYITLDTLPSGIYYANIRINGYKNDYIDTDVEEKKFYLLNPNIKPRLDVYFSEEEKYSRSEFAAMTENELQDEFKKTKIIASRNEIDVWENLTDFNAQKHFLYSFWKYRDPDSTTAVNEYREEFRERIKYANTYFSIGGINNGWSTDRGKIYLKYGNPTEREMYQSDPDTKPYEEWFYAEMQGGVYFYFVDVYRNGSYKYVHSTAYGEMYNARWQEMYLKDKSTGNVND